MTLRRITLTQAAHKPRLDFVLPGLLAGSVGLIVGQGAIGKSFLGLQLGIAIASGRRLAGGLWADPNRDRQELGPTGHVTVVFGEDQPALIQERLHWLRQAEGIEDEEAAQIDEALHVVSGCGEDLRVLTTGPNGHPFQGLSSFVL